MAGQGDQDLKKLIKEGMLEVLISDEGQTAIVSAMGSTKARQAIKEGSLDAMRSQEGKMAIREGALEAMRSQEGKMAIREGALDAMRSREGEEIFMDNFSEAVKETLSPAFEGYSKRIKRVEDELGVIAE